MSGFRRYLIALQLILATHVNTSTVFAQTVDSSVIRAAGAICGAGLSIEAQGDLDARIAKIFGSVSMDGKSSIDIGQVNDLLAAFESADRNEAFKTYATCVVQTVSSMTGVALAAEGSDGSSSVSIDNFMLPSPLAVVQDNQRFRLQEGDVRAVFSDDLVFSVTNYRTTGQFGYRVSDFSTGETRSGWVYENEFIGLTDRCNLLPYHLQPSSQDKKLAEISFLLKCNG